MLVRCSKLVLVYYITYEEWNLFVIQQDKTLRIRLKRNAIKKDFETVGFRIPKLVWFYGYLDIRPR